MECKLFTGIFTFDGSGAVECFMITTSVNQNLTSNNKLQAANKFRENDRLINKSVYFDILEKQKMFMQRWPGTVDDPELSSSLYYQMLVFHDFEWVFNCMFKAKYCIMPLILHICFG